MSPAKTVRARKARRSSTCPACRSPIYVGELIASVQGGRWRHAVAPPRPGRRRRGRPVGRPVETLDRCDRGSPERPALAG